jgi:hypothetical protein
LVCGCVRVFCPFFGSSQRCCPLMITLMM